MELRTRPTVGAVTPFVRGAEFGRSWCSTSPFAMPLVAGVLTRSSSTGWGPLGRTTTLVIVFGSLSWERDHDRQVSQKSTNVWSRSRWRGVARGEDSSNGEFEDYDAFREVRAGAIRFARQGTEI